MLMHAALDHTDLMTWLADRLHGPHKAHRIQHSLEHLLMRIGCVPTLSTAWRHPPVGFPGTGSSEHFDVAGIAR